MARPRAHGVRFIAIAPNHARRGGVVARLLIPRYIRSTQIRVAVIKFCVPIVADGLYFLLRASHIGSLARCLSLARKINARRARKAIHRHAHSIQAVGGYLVVLLPNISLIHRIFPPCVSLLQ